MKVKNDTKPSKSLTQKSKSVKHAKSKSHKKKHDDDDSDNAGMDQLGGFVDGLLR